MKKISMLIVAVAGAWLLACSTPTALGAENEGTRKGGEAKGPRTIKGDGKCAKCALKETDACQNVIEVERKDGKKVVYYLAQNDVSKDFHKHLCKGSAKVTATGTARKTGEKLEFTATKIELVK